MWARSSTAPPRSASAATVASVAAQFRIVGAVVDRAAALGERGYSQFEARISVQEKLISLCFSLLPARTTIDTGAQVAFSR